jgi:hypothetical protein
MKMRILRVFSFTLFSYAALAADPSQVPTAAELLAKFTAALNSLRSVSLTVEGTLEASNHFVRPVGPTECFDGSKVSDRPMTTYLRLESRSDGVRYAVRLYQWGNVGSATKWTPADQPAYNSTYWNGRQKYDQNKGINTPGSVGLVTLANLPPTHEQVLWHLAAYGFVRGYLPPAELRLDDIVRTARSLSVRPETVMVNGFACYVIDATTDRGRVCLCIDPAHGYLAARAAQTIVPGNLGLSGCRIPKGSTDQRSWEITRFEQKGKVWVPMEVKVSRDMNFGATREFSHDTATYKCTEFVLNPDHGALRSFDWKYDPELKEGAKFHYSMQLDNFIWQDGKLVPDPVHPHSGRRSRS